MANPAYSEIELLKAAIKGNTSAFESIVKKYQSLICAITFSAIPDVEKSEDLAQETFLHVWNNLSQLKDLNKFRSWLIRITRNIITDYLRKQKRDLIKKAGSIEEIENKRTKKSEPGRQASIKEQQAIVQNALMQIPQKYREPLVLFYRQEKSIKNIAEQLEMSEEIIKQHLSRGRKLLREQVAAMVERTISRSGPKDIFTSAVMVSIISMAVTGSGTAAAAGVGTATSSTTTGAAVMSGIAAKIVTAAAVVAVGIGTVVIYKNISRTDENSYSPTVTNPVEYIEDVEQAVEPDNIASTGNMDTESAMIQELVQPSNVSSIDDKDEGFEITANSSEYKSPENSDTGTSAIMLKNKPYNSSYEYFLFSRYNQESSTRTLVLAHITDNEIELKDIVTEDFGTYHWAEPICVTGGKLYSVSYYNLYSIDLLTKETEQLTARSTNLSGNIFSFSTPDTIFDFSNSIFERCFANNCLYGLAKTGAKTTLRQIDFQRRAYRDIADISLVQSSRNIAISPDKKRLAYFSREPYETPLSSSTEKVYFLTIVDIESGKITQPAMPIKFLVPMIASVFPGIPIIWLDSETVAFIRTEIPEGENMFSPDKKAAHILSTANVNTGQMEDITPLPGNPYMRFAPDLIQDNIGIGPIVQPKHNSPINYRLDLKNRKLVENDLIAGNYGYEFERLHYKDKDLGLVKSRYYKVSDDGERIIWMSDEPVITDSNENKEAAYRASMGTDDNLLYYYDEAQDGPVAIAGVYNSAGIWLRAEDLKARPSQTDLGPEWTHLKDISKNLTIQTNIPIRKYIRDYLTCTMEIDKTIYQLHEPIQVKVTLTNKSDTDITVSKPNVIESVMKPLAGLTISYPGGQASIDSGAQPYSPQDEEIILRPGQSVSDTDVLEVPLSGDYQLDYKYQKHDPQDYYFGTVTAEPVAFKVVQAADASAEQRLFETKFARIMEKFYIETAKDPNWNGNNNICDEIIGLPGMGPEVAPYLIKVLENEKHKNYRDMLFRALCDVAGPQYLPFFKERLINSEDDNERICSWILETYRESGSNDDIREQAIEALLLGMEHEDVEVRRIVCNYLTKIYDERIENCLLIVVDDEDEQIRLNAAHYLAAAEWLDLNEWLNVTVNDPTYVRYIAAVSIVRELEGTWNITQGKLPVLTKEDFVNSNQLLEEFTKVISAWQSWANENPRASFLFFEEYREKWLENDPLREE